MLGTIAVGTDNTVKVLNLQTESDGAYQNTATVTFTLFAEDKVTVIAGPTTMNYDGKGTGGYIGILPYNTPVVEKSYYWIQVVAIAPTARKTWMVRKPAQYPT